MTVAFLPASVKLTPMPESFTLPAFAKINLFLRIHGRREDGYHELCTVFQTVSLYDSLTFSLSTYSRINLTCDNKDVPTGEDNLVYRAASLLKKEFKVDKGADIHLEKRIPSPGGLGGGSSDAAVTLIGLIKLWQINTDIMRLNGIAQSLGSDVPFFLYGGTALGTGTGADITPMDDFGDRKMLIVTPSVNVATADAYSLLIAPALTKSDSNRILTICHNEAKKLITEQSELRNDFEDVVFKSEPELARVRNSLLETGADTVSMSGSGASFFALFSNETARQDAFAGLKAKTGWRVFAVETVSRSRYLDQLQPCSDLLQKLTGRFGA